MSDLVFLSATEQLHLLRSGQISAAELAEAHIVQISQQNPRLRAIVDFDAERVRAQAGAVRPGLLSGLPLTIKSSISTAGQLCEIGSVLHRQTRPTTDAAAVAALRREGAVLLGTTNCPEFLMAYETDNDLYGQTRNPWSMKHSVGGSSGGEAAAIAAGMSAGGLGSDSGGSVRIPAHFAGICALKPTSGRISAQGHLPPCIGPFARLGALGPMARTVEDLALLFGVLAQPALQPLTLQQARAIPIGYFEEDEGGASPELRTAVRMARDVLTNAGFRVQPIRLTGLREAERLWWLFFVQCGAMFYGPTIAGKHHELSPIFREFLETAAAEGTLSVEELLFAWADWDELCASLLQQMERFPVLLMPPCAMPAFPLGERNWNTETGPRHYFHAMRYSQWFNVLAAPAAVVPVTQTAAGLPVGVQIAGRPFEDEWVLAVAGVLDAAFGYRVPPSAAEDAPSPADCL